MIIAVDFDGTIVEHEFPGIGQPVPGAVRWLKKFQEAGAQIILWTMRSGEPLIEACRHLDANGIKVWAVNQNPEQDDWTTSNKAYAHVYIDDAAFGCPLRRSNLIGGRPMVDWSIVGPAVMAMIEAK